MLFSKQVNISHARVELALREVTLADIPRITLLAGDWDVARMTGRIPYPYSEAAALHWVEGLSPGEIVRAITLEGELIGICGIAPFEDDEKSAELGYWLGKPFWGFGYATTAARMIIQLAFEEMKIERLTAGHFTDNPASGRVLEKLGFNKTGPCLCWCDARLREVDAMDHELHRPKSWWRRPVL